MNKIIKWTPRVLVILLIAFFLLMSLDSFAPEYRWYEMIIGFIMHNIPTLLIAGTLWLSWTQPKIGGWLYILLAAITVLFFNIKEDPTALLFTTLPLLIIGTLFLLTKSNSSAKIRSKK